MVSNLHYSPDSLPQAWPPGVLVEWLKVARVDLLQPKQEPKGKSLPHQIAGSSKNLQPTLNSLGRTPEKGQTRHPK